MSALKESKLIKELTKKTSFKRTIFFIVFDIMLISFSGYASFWLRFDGEIPFPYKSNIIHYILLSLVIRLFFLSLYDLYRISWRYVGLTELLRTLKALSLSFLTIGLCLFLLKAYIPFEGFPRSILLIDFVLSLIFIGLLRISRRGYFEFIRRNVANLRVNSEIKKKRVLIVGANNTGEKIVREMLSSRESEYLPWGIIDDDPSTQGIKIHGIEVAGRKEDIPKLVKDNNIDEVLIAAPKASSREIKEIVEIVRNSEGVRNIKIIPSIVDLMNGEVTLSDIQEVSLEDLLGRDPVEIDMNIIGGFLKDKVILVTGAGGSIGEELSRTILNFHPGCLIGLDYDDTYIFKFLDEVGSFKGKVIPIIGDIRDKIKIEDVFKRYRPHIVFHSAAYKHVPVLESFPDEAVKTNISGTRIVAECSIDYSTEKFINISTDKAVNPISIMGATKLATEEMVKALNSKNTTKFISVRFGNVLGSRGSVVPIFEKMIKRGGPVAVTHPDMKRYFMSISESVLLVLEASALGDGGEVFVLDMGNPIKIIDLAKEMIRLSGFEADVDIPIIFSKKRPGEKIVEELWADYEKIEKTRHQKLLRVRSDNQKNSEKLLRDIDLLIELSHKSNSNLEIIKLLEEMFPSFKYAERNL